MAGTVRIEGDDVVFELHGVDELLAVKRSMSVPLDHVVSVSTENQGWKPLRQLKVVGASIPGVVKDGRFFDPSQGLIFFEMHHPERCITVGLDHETYRKVVFEVDDKEAAAETIRKALDSRKGR